jgi:hypothetical protein
MFRRINHCNQEGKTFAGFLRVFAPRSLSLWLWLRCGKVRLGVSLSQARAARHPAEGLRFMVLYLRPGKTKARKRTPKCCMKYQKSAKILCWTDCPEY